MKKSSKEVEVSVDSENLTTKKREKTMNKSVNTSQSRMVALTVSSTCAFAVVLISAVLMHFVRAIVSSYRNA